MFFFCSRRVVCFVLLEISLNVDAWIYQNHQAAGGWMENSPKAKARRFEWLVQMAIFCEFSSVGDF